MLKFNRIINAGKIARIAAVAGLALAASACTTLPQNSTGMINYSYIPANGQASVGIPSLEDF